ncbi:MAG: YaiI/YqxD family protein [Alphaproteobacteria bacterium]|nr:YaiI/YqxD family protein [Alphaproteobacteria bacterium]
MTAIYVDADACPVKDEAVRVALRHRVGVFIVSNGGIRPRPEPGVEMVIVGDALDAADDWIAERARRGDVVITNDIPLAARAVAAGARVVKPNGEAVTEAGVGQALAARNLLTGLREAGAITGGPPPFSKRDRSRFLDTLETTLRAAARDT